MKLWLRQNRILNLRHNILINNLNLILRHNYINNHSLSIFRIKTLVRASKHFKRVAKRLKVELSAISSPSSRRDSFAFAKPSGSSRSHKIS
ncbi:MAG: hypothetical protein [Microviridae sp. ctnrr37]|nr:MAG: hypothetical protein [Microviridae sp. ctnrr37]